MVESRGSHGAHDLGAICYRKENQSQAILEQMLQAAQGMQYIDELFLWVTSTFIHKFDVQVAQIWSCQNRSAMPSELRALACKNASLPYTSIINQQIIALAAFHLRAQQNLTLQPLHRLLPPDYAKFLSQYQLNYCCGFFMSDNTLLPRPTMQPATQDRPVTIALLPLLFFQTQSSYLPIISYILEQILPIARNCGLLFLQP